jgi:iron uptake system component EfeO
MRAAVAVAALAVPALLAAGCGSGSGSSATSTSSEASPAAHNSLSVSITDAGCDPSKLTVAAGPTTFEVENKGATKVTEYEVLDGTRILGEAENLAPGLSGTFSLTLKPGTYELYCPGGTSSDRGTLEVTGSGAAAASSLSTQAVVAYRRYVEQQTTALVTQTTRFADAVKARNVVEAKRLYAAARVPYERIEPVAESFGNLDAAIDAREGDVYFDDWTGFHPLEKAVFLTGDLAGTPRLADKLVRDVKRLRGRVPGMKLEAAQVANGAVELLGEVSQSKLTGEEERYSHIDLVDVQANVDGAKAAFDAVRPIVEKSDPGLARTIDARFAAVGTALAAHRAAGPSGFVAYTALTRQQTRSLSQAVDALGEPLSRVGAIVVAHG